jgi:hypothetical protein
MLFKASGCPRSAQWALRMTIPLSTKKNSTPLWPNERYLLPGMVPVLSLSEDDVAVI